MNQPDICEVCKVPETTVPLYRKNPKGETVIFRCLKDFDTAVITYKGFTITHDPKPISSRAWDYDFAHKDYDGPGDIRCGNGSSVEDCKAQIDEILEDQ
jgi:hypothetical protein